MKIIKSKSFMKKEAIWSKGRNNNLPPGVTQEDIDNEEEEEQEEQEEDTRNEYNPKEDYRSEEDYRRHPWMEHGD